MTGSDPFGLHSSEPVPPAVSFGSPGPEGAAAGPPVAASTGRRLRGRALGLVALMAAVVASATLGLSIFFALDTIDVLSTDPFGPALAWSTMAAAAAIVAVLAVPLAVVAVVLCRPRRIATLALAAAMVLPVATVVVVVPVGLQVARQNAANALTASGGVADRMVALADQWDVHLGPARDLLRSILGPGGGRDD